MASKKGIPDFYIGGDPKIKGNTGWGGLNTAIKDPKALPPGTARSSLNFLTGLGQDHIELRMGISVLGLTTRSTVGRVTGMGVGVRGDGVQIPFFSFAQSIYHYDPVANDTFECASESTATNVLGAAASGEDVAFCLYSNLAGNWMYASSPHSSIFKIPVCDPGNAVDLQSYAYRGLMTIYLNRMFMWTRNVKQTNFNDVNYQSLSYSDETVLSNYPSVPSETYGTGNGTTKTFTHTLAKNWTSIPPVTSFQISIYGQITTANISAITQATNGQITAAAHGFVVGDQVVALNVTGMTQINGILMTVASVIDANNFTVDTSTASFTAYINGGTIGKCEFFLDDGLGNLTSNLGGTGSINYATGVSTVTFNTAPIALSNDVIASYLYENSSSAGITDFTFTSGGRTAGQGNAIPFFGAGLMQGAFSYNGSEFIMKQFTTWALDIPADDTQTSSQIYRQNVGIPYWRAGFATDDGIIYLDVSNQIDPVVRLLSLQEYSTNVIPVPLSEDVLDLTLNRFQKPSIFAWGNYYFLSCQGITQGEPDPSNNFVYMYNKVNQRWDLTDLNISCFTQYNNQLLGGDSLTNNVWQIFNGYDDDGSVINNYWESGMLDLGVEGLKRGNRFLIDGFINPNQNFDIFAVFDSGQFVLIGNISGQGTYVDTSQGTMIGTDTVGSQIVGSGATVNAFHFRYEFTITNSPARYEYATIKFVANDVGALQINTFAFRDIRYKGRRTIPAYEATNQ